MQHPFRNIPGEHWIGIITAGGTGIGIMLLATGVIPSDDSQFHAPRWVVFLAGAVFFFAGASILFQHISERLATVFSAILVTCMAVIPAWITLGPGQRECTSSLSLPIPWFESFAWTSGDMMCRIGFFPGLLITGVIALAIWGSVLKWSSNQLNKD